MRNLLNVVPIDLLLDMEPEELASKLLSVIKGQLRRGDHPFVHLGNSVSELSARDRQGVIPVPPDKREAVRIAITEAWNWLEVNALLIPAEGANGQNGFRILGRRAHKIADDTDFAQFLASRTLPKEILHRRIADKVWSAFLRGEYESAVFQAMKAVEVYVREAGGFGNDLVGVALMQEAFKRDGGLLTDMAAEPAERVSRMQLFCGAVGSYKNPSSHRDVNFEDANEAIEVIMLANHLLRIVDVRAKASEARNA